MGCGNGRQATASWEPRAAKVVGLDLHPGCIEYAQRRFGSERTQFKVSLIKTRRDFRCRRHVRCARTCHDPRGSCARGRSRDRRGPSADQRPQWSRSVRDREFLQPAASDRSLVGGAGNKAAGFLNRFVFVGPWLRVLTPDDAPYNHESLHVQFFTHGDIERLLHDNGFEILEQRKLACVAGPVTNTLLAPWHWALRVNIALGERLPTNWTVAWCFVARRLPRPAISVQRRNEGRPTHAKDE